MTSSIIVLLLLAALLGYLGKDRKFGFWGNFFVSLILTPIVGVIVLLAQGSNCKSDSVA